MGAVEIIENDDQGVVLYLRRRSQAQMAGLYLLALIIVGLAAITINAAPMEDHWEEAKLAKQELATKKMHVAAPPSFPRPDSLQCLLDRNIDWKGYDCSYTDFCNDETWGPDMHECCEECALPEKGPGVKAPSATNQNLVSSQDKWWLAPAHDSILDTWNRARRDTYSSWWRSPVKPCGLGQGETGVACLQGEQCLTRQYNGHEWAGYGCNQNTCYKYRTGPWSGAVKNCCATECEKDWCLQSEWTWSQWTCSKLGSTSMRYCNPENQHYAVASGCCKDVCDTYSARRQRCPSPPRPCPGF